MELDLLKKMLRDMLLARAFEERAAQEYAQGNIAGFLHLYPGEEAAHFASASPAPTLTDAETALNCNRHEEVLL